MASINSLTEESVYAEPWIAIETAVHNNPTELAIALARYTDLDVPEEPNALFNWIQDYYRRHGHLEVLVEASKDVPIIGATGGTAMGLKYSTTDQDTEEKGKFNWGGFIGGIIQGAVNGLGLGQNASQAEYQAALAAQQAAAARRNMNMLLIAVGLIAAGIVAFVVLKK